METTEQPAELHEQHSEDSISFNDIKTAFDESEEPEAEPAPQPTPEPTPEPPRPAVEPPSHWPAEQRERFAKLDPDSQQWMLDQHRSMVADYTRKTQQAAEMRKAIAEEFDKRTQRPPEAKPEQPPEDPVERIKWEAKQEALAVMQQHREADRAEMAKLSHQQQLQAVQARVQADPLYQPTMQALEGYIKSQPPAMQPRIFRELDQNPQAYLDAYKHLRGMVVQHLQRQQQPPPATEVERVKKAPVLESSAGDAPKIDPKEAQRRQIKQQIAKGSVDSSTLGSYLDSLGTFR